MVYGQGNISIKVVPQGVPEGNNICFSLDVKSNSSESIKLASMNYRIFYNSDNLKMADEGIKLTFPTDAYSLRVVQNLKEVNAEGTGPLPFERNLGFLNFSVLFQDGSPAAIQLNKSESWLSIIELCFDIMDLNGPQSIVLARQEMTANYGKAFVELSAYDQKDQIVAAKIVEYKDYISQRPN